MDTTLKNYKQQIQVSTNKKDVFYTLNEGLNLWWGSISDSSFELNGAFTITFENGYWWRFQIIEFIPNQKLTWKCIDGEPEFNKEWIGHELHWIISGENQHTTINFLQIGLTPKLHCYNVCSSTWDMFITKKLQSYLIQISNST
ncbi:MAG: hypothetical protein ACON5F_08530 [Jejuia sp.]